MAAERHPADSRRIPSLIEKFQNRRYRNSYVASHTRRFLARQMRKFRGDKSQTEFGDSIGKQQTVVSRLEDSAYGKWTLQTLFDVAAKLDVAVIVRFVDHATFLRFTENMSDEATVPSAYNQATLDEMLKPQINQSLIDRINRSQSFEFQPPTRPSPPIDAPTPQQPRGLLQ
jgi:hypothetical protein